MDPVLVLEPNRRSRAYWRDLWRYRELFRVLAWRDLTVRYKQTVIGILWAVIRPALTLAILTFVFGRLARLPPEPGVPYAALVFAGLLPWTLFSMALSEAASSLVTNANLISKVYFPRLIVPTASVVVALVDFSIGLALCLLLFAVLGVTPDWRILVLPAFVALAFLASMGPALWLAAMNVEYRDFRYVVPFLLQFGLYISPVGYMTEVVPEHLRLLYSLNPMVGVIDGFRWCLLGGETPLYLPAVGISAGVTALCLLLGLQRFRKMEARFADVI